jgi:hypothetical protein
MNRSLTRKENQSEYKEIEVSRVADILDVIDKYPSLMFFRGQSDARWQLVPKISRLYKKGKIPDTWPRLESFILDEFQKYAAINIKREPKNKFEWMVIGQHYGLPTRLLDWTTNPLKAAYFAVAEYSTKRDGALFAFSPTMTIPKVSSEDDFDKNNYLIPVFPDIIDPRIAAQEGCFTLFPFAPDHELFRPLEDTSNYDGSYYMMLKIIIPRDKKRTIRYDLDRLGINSRILFPDLSGLSDFIIWNFKEGRI